MNTGPAAKNFANWMNRIRMVNGDYKLTKTRAPKRRPGRKTASVRVVCCCCCCYCTMLCAVLLDVYIFVHTAQAQCRIKYATRAFFFVSVCTERFRLCRVSPVFVCVRSLQYIRMEGRNGDDATNTHTNGRTHAREVLYLTEQQIQQRTIETKEMWWRAIESARKKKET